MPSTLSAGCGKRVSKNFGRSVELVFLHVPIDVRRHVFDADPAAELFAEERDVAADDRPEIEEQRAFAGLQAA